MPVVKLIFPSSCISSKAYFNLCVCAVREKVHCSSITDTAFVIAHYVLSMVGGGMVVACGYESEVIESSFFFTSFLICWTLYYRVK